MTAKRKPPTLHHNSKQEVNKKAILWVGLSLALIIIVMIVLLIVNG